MVSTRVTARSPLTVHSLPGIPEVRPGDHLGELIAAALERNELDPKPNDVLVVASKIVSRAEDRFVNLETIEPSPRGLEIAEQVGKDPRLVEVILGESVSISRMAPGVVITRHRLGFVSANAGVDASNARPRDQSGDSWVLLLPREPDATAATIAAHVEERFGVKVGVIVSDSHGRPFRFGAVGMAIGLAGLSALSDERGRVDLHGRTLEFSTIAVADAIAAIADVMAGQADEARPVTLVRGLSFELASSCSARDLCRPPEEDLYA